MTMKKSIWQRYSEGEKLQPTFRNGKTHIPPTKVDLSKVIRTEPIRVKEVYSDINLFIIMLILFAVFCLLTFKIF